MGKNWSKGLTAATDGRVARAATSHRGMAYTRRKPLGECRWPNASQTTLSIEWSNEMAYIVGLTATDGCLISGKRAINFKSEDRDLVETYLGALGRTNRIRAVPTSSGGIAFVTQFADARLYRWFMSVGLTPRKSLTLGAIDVPAEFLAPLARGLMDGDGSIANFVHARTPATYPQYRYERLMVRFNSASRRHIVWLQGRLAPLLPDMGHITRTIRAGRHDMFALAFGKYSSIALLKLFYPDPGVPSLTRKRRIWDDYVRRHASADESVRKEGFEPSRLFRP